MAYHCNVRSTFTKRIFLPLTVLALVIGVLLIVSFTLVDRLNDDWIPVTVFYICFLFIFCWLVFGEMRVRMIAVGTTEDHLVVASFLGLGKKRKWYFLELDGYETVLLPSRYRTYEYLFILRSGKRVVRLSAYYHRNYEELKTLIARKLKHLGSDGFRISKELNDMFG